MSSNKRKREEIGDQECGDEERGKKEVVEHDAGDKDGSKKHVHWSRWVEWAKKRRRRGGGLQDFCPKNATIDLNRIQGWIKECHTYHGENCNNRYSDALAQQCGDLVLVDVINGCVVDRPNTTKFVALSYVWGRTAMPKLQRSNYESLKQPGKLFGQHIDGIRVPQVIQDAIYLVRKLEERYLWVDSLCVMQDASAEDMERTLQAMGRIYASAEFTIVAAGGSDADHGLRGIGGPSLSRTPDGKMYSAQSLVCGVAFPERSVWASRGWTFQESAFARRLLIFDTVVAWACGRCVWREHYYDHLVRPKDWPSERPHETMPMGLTELITTYPSLRRWGTLVETYSSRQLTHEGDFVRAFAGASSAVDPTFPGGLIHGLPKFFLDICLLWRPYSDLSRRSESPSWSWTGWKGTVCCVEAWSVAEPGLAERNPTGEDLAEPGLYQDLDRDALWIPGVKMKAVAVYQEENSNETGLNGFYKYQALRELSDEILPAGWTRIEHPRGVYFTHPDTGGNQFRCAYPLPLASSTNASMSASTHTSTHLICTAPIATLSLGEFWGTDRVSLVLADVVVGLLNIHSIYDGDISQTRIRSSCELVAISEAEVQNKDLSRSWFGYDHLAYRKRKGYSYYNVLRIHWEAGIAYRKGIGQVEKEAWDSIGAQVRTFKLG
jgi:hypothetical protein